MLQYRGEDRRALNDINADTISFAVDGIGFYIVEQYMNCTVRDCDRLQHGRQMCCMHYMSWWRYGDPLTTRRTRNHYMNSVPERNVWQKMKQRCYNTKDKSYKDYGARGIQVCDRWKEAFINFYEDMGSRPSSIHSIERKDNNGNYEPSNCIWATKDHQLNNYRHNRFITINGKTQSLKRWVDELGLRYGRVHRRLYAYGWTNEEALELVER